MFYDPKIRFYTKKNTGLLEQLKTNFEVSFNCNKYRSDMITQAKHLFI